MAITYMVLDGYMVVDTILQTRGKNLLKARKVEEDVGPSRQGYYDIKNRHIQRYTEVSALPS